MRDSYVLQASVPASQPGSRDRFGGVVWPRRFGKSEISGETDLLGLFRHQRTGKTICEGTRFGRCSATLASVSVPFLGRHTRRSLVYIEPPTYSWGTYPTRLCCHPVEASQRS